MVSARKLLIGYMETMQEKRFTELDILRGFAMLTVVAVHVISLPLANMAEGRRRLLVFLFRYSLNFEVPALLLISTLLSAHSNAGQSLAIWPY